MKQWISAAIVMGVSAVQGIIMHPASGQIRAHSLDSPPAQPAASGLAADSSNAFAFDLFARFCSRQTEKTNLFFSPYSISSALTMIDLGARGKTADEISAVLHLPADRPGIASSFSALNSSLIGDEQKQGYALEVANALWGRSGEPFRQEYLETVKKDFAGELTPMDFAAHPDPSRIQINQWVSDKTHGKIEDLLPAGSISSDTQLVLTNAIYFKGGWTNAFVKERTRPDAFSTGDAKVHVDFMHESEHFAYAEDDVCQAVRLPYQGDRLSMLILLPRLPEVDAVRKGFGAEILGLEKLQGALNADYLKRLVGQLAERTVNLTLPRWQATQQMNLTSTLAQMGIKAAFTQHADFSGINGKTDLALSDVIHKAFVKVDEQGTEAAGASGVVMRATAIRIGGPPPVNFVADRPFVYLITDDQTGVILFAGRLCDPSR